MQLFNKVLVANRGEIAVQIIRNLQEMGVATVAVYSTADRESQFVQLADEAVCIGGPQPAQSYLNMPQIINTAILLGCDAIHPGYGFLAENAAFAQLCEDCQIKFIGPRAAVIETMGDKAHARQAMQQAGVPVVPGSKAVVTSATAAAREAQRIGYPVLLKASAGGGGKGIRRVDQADQLIGAFHAAQQEAQTAVGDDSIYIEKVIVNARHVEMQVIADEAGHVVYLPERDCSLQRHHQKIIEESPCSALDEDHRQALGQRLVQACRQLGYTNTGTFEFLMDQDQQFYFMEMNTRLQVEYTVTEEVTGLELIKAQILVAAGEPLPFTQDDVQIHGTALECRLNAEDPANQFQPVAGRIERLDLPAGTHGVRIDSGVVAGNLISPFYDSMITKVIVHMDDRHAVLHKMRRVMNELTVTGIITNRSFLLALLADANVIEDQFTTVYVEQEFLGRMQRQTEKTVN